MRRTIVTGLLFILVLYSIWSAWALLSSKNTVMALREAGEDKEETINQLSLELRQARNSNGTNREEIHKFISDAFSYLSKAEASDLLKRFWVYEIKVNDYLLPANGIIAIDANDVTVVTSQRYIELGILPREMEEAGKLAAGYKLEFIETQPSNIDGTDSTTGSTVKYSFDDIPAGSTIKFKISEEHQNRLRLRTNIIQIHVERKED